MRINKQAEPLVREILAGVAKRDGDRFTRGLEALPDEETAQEALTLALSIAKFVLSIPAGADRCRGAAGGGQGG